jgi:hypothetical protein
MGKATEATTLDRSPQGRRFKVDGAVPAKGAETEHAGTLTRHVDRQGKQSTAAAPQKMRGVTNVYSTPP